VPIKISDGLFSAVFAILLHLRAEENYAARIRLHRAAAEYFAPMVRAVCARIRDHTRAVYITKSYHIRAIEVFFLLISGAKERAYWTLERREKEFSCRGALAKKTGTAGE
jgi:hypothetical protein